MTTGFCTSPRFADHVTGPGHPEQPDRIRAVCRALAEAGYITMPAEFEDFRFDFGDLPKATQPLVEISPIMADENLLRLIHTPELIDQVRNIAANGGGRIDADTVVGPNSFAIACLAVGAAVRSTAAVLDGQAKRCFAAVRPPGHHAERNQAMGFCLFNNVAIAARFAQKQFGLDRVAIIDFDVHHGNGTQAAFIDDPTVLYISVHQDPRTCYPGTGYERETGIDAGEGFTLNIPLSPGSSDAEYRHVFSERIQPALHEFGPELLFVSAGFDAHIDDPLAEMRISDEGFYEMSRQIREAAEQYCGGRLVSILEGGYDLRALGRSVSHHLKAIAE